MSIQSNIKSLIKIGARSSKLSVAQVNMVVNELEKTHSTEFVPILTSGDRRSAGEISSPSDKKDWVYEIEQALLTEEIDVAVHSAKDVPIDIDPGTAVTSVLKRANPFDAFIGGLCPQKGRRLKLSELKPGSVIGTTSLRRQAQLMRLRPDLSFIEMRGNVQTRLDKLDNRQLCDGLVLAYAGLQRLGIEKLCSDIFSENELLPSVNQGILIAQYKKGNQKVGAAIGKLVDGLTHDVWLAERACVETLEADCHSCMGVFAKPVTGEDINISCRVISRDGRELIEETVIGSRSKAQQLGKLVAKKCLESGAGSLLHC